VIAPTPRISLLRSGAWGRLRGLRMVGDHRAGPIGHGVWPRAVQRLNFGNHALDDLAIIVLAPASGCDPRCGSRAAEASDVMRDFTVYIWRPRRVGDADGNLKSTVKGIKGKECRHGDYHQPYSGSRAKCDKQTTGEHA